MGSTGSRSFALAAVLGVLLTACSSSSSSPAPPAPTNISGDYAGTLTDSVYGAGTATGTLAQTGSTAGGQITYTAAKQTQTLNMSVTINGQNAIAGAMVVDYSSGTTCTFSVTGNYSTTTNILSGSYTSVTNCGSQNGTFSLTQQCIDTITKHVRRDKVGGISTC